MYAFITFLFLSSHPGTKVVPGSYPARTKFECIDTNKERIWNISVYRLFIIHPLPPMRPAGKGNRPQTFRRRRIKYLKEKHYFCAHKIRNSMNLTPAELRNLLKAKYDDREAAALARIVCCEMMGQRPTSYVLNEPLCPDAEARQQLDDIVQRLLRFEPLQYIEGKARFLGRDFGVGPGVLIPRPETEELVERVLKETAPGAHVLDIGTGSGCIAVTLALEVPGSYVEAWDISPAALAVARANSKRLEADVVFRQQDVLAHDPEATTRFDVLVSNPPYVTESEEAGMAPNVLLYEPAGALFVPDNDPLLFYRHIAQLGQKLLHPGGRLYFEINRTFGREMAALLEGQGYTDIRVEKDLSGNDRFAMARRPVSDKYHSQL